MRGWESQASGYKGQTVTPRTATALLRPGRACFRPFEAIRRQRHGSTLSHGVLALYPQASAPSLLYLVAMAHRVACWLIHVHEPRRSSL